MTRKTQDQPRDDIQVFIKSTTYYGAYYALETLSQLVTFHQAIRLTFEFDGHFDMIPSFRPSSTQGPVGADLWPCVDT